MPKRLIKLGWREYVQLPNVCGSWLKAKVDTGARSSSLHAYDLEIFERDGSEWVRFRVGPDTDLVEMPVLEQRSVKSSTGVSEVRPVIVTAVLIGPVERDVEITLTNRDEMGFPMLLGRQTLRGRFEVDPSRSFALGGMPQPGERAAFAIGDVRVTAGQAKRVEFSIAKLATGPQVSIPVKVFHGVEDGPTVWVNAAIHGDEIGGVEIIRRVLREVDPQTIRGTLIVVPVVNVHGFTTNDRYLPDRRDLNRSFPGGTKGSLARRIANLMVTEVIERCSVGIDLHTGSDGRTNLPQIRADLGDPQTAHLARTFGAPVMVDSKPRAKSLRSAAVATGATVLAFEGGEASRFDQAAVEAGTNGVLRVLAELGVIDPVAPPMPTLQRATNSRWVRAPKSGLAQLDCALGDRVEAGQVIGRIHDSFGRRLGRCKSPIEGLVIGLRLEPLVNRGDALIHVASIVSEVHP